MMSYESQADPFSAWLGALLLVRTGTPGAGGNGLRIQHHFICASETEGTANRSRSFRKRFAVAETPASATLHVFADHRYRLHVNDHVVQRGPLRFDPDGPSYDSLDVTPYLQTGPNTVALEIMKVREGMATDGHRSSTLGACTNIVPSPDRTAQRGGLPCRNMPLFQRLDP